MSAPHVAEVYSLVQHPLPGGFTLICPSDYQALLIHLNKPCTELSHFIEQWSLQKQGPSMRREVNVAGFPVLLAVIAGEKKILAGSRRLARELLLLDACEREGIDAHELRDHARAMSTLDSRHFPTEWEWVTSTEKLPDWRQVERWATVEELTKEKLRHLVRHVQSYRPTLFERVSDWGLGLTAQFALIRIHLLKFLALLPSLDHDQQGFEVKRNLIESLRRLLSDDRRLRQRGVSLGGTRPLPRPYVLGLKFGLMAVRVIPAGMLAFVVRALVKKMAKRFIAGESIATSDKTLQSLHDSRREATLDQLGELVVSEGEADEYLKRVLAIVHGLKIHVQSGERNGAGINKAHVSIKVSALSHDFKPHAYEYTYNLVAPRLRQILVEARREQVFINIDAEHYHYRDLVLRIYRQVLLETPELHGWSDTGIVLQAYLRDGATHLRDIIALARERGVRMPIRLVKGAYWDAETIEATAHSHHAPQFLNKEESDLHFRQLAAMTLAHPAELQLALGSHNLQDHCFAEALRQLHYPDAPVIEHQCLHMTYEALSHGLARMGWPTRNYMPIGNLLVGMAYLVRRIMENSSQVGILTIMRSHNKKDAFGAPLTVHETKLAQGELVRDELETALDSGFKNCTPVRLYVRPELDQFLMALKTFRTEIESKQEQFKTAVGVKINCNSHPSLLVGVINELTPEEAIKHAQDLYQGMKQGNGWTEKPRSYRLGVILKAADRMWQERNRLAALIVFEAGKAWSEALADVDEAIDFLNFYVREDLRWSTELKSAQPRGVTAVIAPWNFPLAIPCGMAVAPLIAGNAVILKPAEQTPLIARELVDLLYAAGVPKTALVFVTGDGEKVGAPLVQSPYISSIVFTGSKGVGQWIYQTASVQAVKHPITEKFLPKKVITEMGGKNAIVVTNNCEQDETVSGILYAAFGHAGQKCSACSRVLVDAEVKDALLARLVKAVKDLPAGPSTLGHVLVNPVVTETDKFRIREAVRQATTEAETYGGKVWVDRSTEAHEGHIVGPVMIELPMERAMHPESWAQREIFGPVIHIVPYRSLDEAVKLFNSTEYGLTGGIYGQSQDDIDYLVRELKCGNLYVNRPNTGARVAIEPFGGFKLSGTGPKAGGRDYMAQFYTMGELESVASKSTWEEGSGYRFELPRASMLSVQGRTLRWEKLAHKVLSHFESLTQTVDEAQKRQLKSFVEWGAVGIPQHLSSIHPNLRIPGQLSYDQKDLAREVALLITGEEAVSLAALIQWLSALASGSGVAIICTNSKSYSVWKGLCELAWQSGFAKPNLEVYFTGKNELQAILENPLINVVYVAGSVEFREKMLAMSLPAGSLDITMRALYHDGEHPPLGLWSAWLDQYLWVRSFAVNTMRHGAPLEIGL